MACKRSCLSTSCELKLTCTYFGNANSYGRVGEQAGQEIAYFDRIYGDYIALTERIEMKMEHSVIIGDRVL